MPIFDSQALYIIGEDRQDNLVDHFEPSSSVVPKHHFIEWFSGDSAINTIWNLTNIAGSGSVSIIDEIDGGAQLITGGSSSNRSQIDFNGKGHYSLTASKCISMCKRATTSSSGIFVGLTSAGDIGATSNDHISISDDTGESGKKLTTANGSAFTRTDLGVSLDTNYNLYEAELLSSSATATINGILEGTNTTTLPDSETLQPAFFVITRTSSARQGNIKYMEVYNT